MVPKGLPGGEVILQVQQLRRYRMRAHSRVGAEIGVLLRGLIARAEHPGRAVLQLVVRLLFGGEAADEAQRIRHHLLLAVAETVGDVRGRRVRAMVHVECGGAGDRVEARGDRRIGWVRRAGQGFRGEHRGEGERGGRAAVDRGGGVGAHAGCRRRRGDEKERGYGGVRGVLQ